MLQIRWHGHSCFEITNDITLVTDPHDGKSIGINAPSVTGDIILVSHDHYDHNSVKSVEKEDSKIVRGFGEKTVSNVLIKGFETFHDEVQGAKRGENVVYKFRVDDITFCHLGDLGHKLNDDMVEMLGDIDVLFVPVGGTFTLNADKAWKVIKMIDPKIVVPMHYKVGGLSLPVSGVDVFLEKNKSKCKVLRVGNEIDIEKDDLPEEQEIWVFTL